jgi:hypothetical protein
VRHSLQSPVFKYGFNFSLSVSRPRLALDAEAHNCYFVGMSIQRVHLHLSKESLSFGRQLARQKKTSISKLVEGFFLGGRNRARSGKPFSERWSGKDGKITMRQFDKSDVRGMRLAKKYA